MNKEIKISSITYVKNGADYIEKCIRSVMEQTLHDIEIIVVDGGSTDGTVEILKCLCAEDSRISLMVHEGSVGGQFNKALKIATGEYIAVCEGDDYILPDKYEKQYLIAKSNNLDIVRADYYQFFNYGGKEYRYKVSTGPSADLYNQVIETDGDDLFLSLGVNGFWNGIYKRKFLLSNDIYMNETKGAAYQDISFSFLCQLHAKRIWFMSEALHCYRIDNLGASVNSPRCIDMHITEYRLLRERLISSGLWDKYQNMFMVWQIGSYKHFIEELSCDNKTAEVLKIYTELTSQNVTESYENVRMPERSNRILSALYSDRELFTKLMLDNEANNNKTIRYFEGKGVLEKNIILFGAGHFGNIIYDFLKAAGKKITVVDNSKKVQAQGFRGEKVYAPEVVVLYNNNPIVVANVIHAKDIYEQLRKLGVDDARIIICDNEDLFLRKVFVRLGDVYGL